MPTININGQIYELLSRPDFPGTEITEFRVRPVVAATDVFPLKLLESLRSGYTLSFSSSGNILVCLFDSSGKLCNSVTDGHLVSSALFTLNYILSGRVRSKFSSFESVADNIQYPYTGLIKLVSAADFVGVTRRLWPGESSNKNTIRHFDLCVQKVDGSVAKMRKQIPYFDGITLHEVLDSFYA
jgi:hypothetical protein